MFGQVMFSNFNSVVSYLYINVVSVVSFYYFLVLYLVLVLFIFYRFPYCYSPYFFCSFLLVTVFGSFIPLFANRLFRDLNGFFSSFIPVGTPTYICPLVCIAETISYLIRPIVLILRPFINISLGCYGAVMLGNLCLVNKLLLLMMFMLFIYEVFVALIHWFIVISILSFSTNH